jgi:hypothetical protein
MSWRDRERRCPQRFPQPDYSPPALFQDLSGRPSSKSAYREMRDSSLLKLSRIVLPREPGRRAGVS